MSSNLTVKVGDGKQNNGGINPHLWVEYQDQPWENSGNGVSEIEEEFSEEQVIRPLESIREEIEASSVFSFDFNGCGGDDVVYVVVGKQSEEITSMDALIWTLNHVLISSSTMIFLIHVFAETKFIPTPLGKLSISQVNPEQKENYMAQERGKRRELLQKFLNTCSTSQVKVDTILIESDMEAKAILDLIPILNIRKLILGTTKSSAKRMRTRRGNGVADQILQNAPEFCEIKIICEGKEMSELAMDSPSPSSSPSPRAADRNTKSSQEQKQTSNENFSCGCFKL